jgi:hypothetical protein
MPLKDQNYNDKDIKEPLLKYWWTIYQLTEQCISTTNFFLNMFI